MKSDPSSAPVGGRVASIDALRGFDMFWLIGGQGVLLAVTGLFVSPIPRWLETQMDHVHWEGFSAWDLIMPLFLFIVGAAMPFSLAKRIEAGQSKAIVYRKIIIRTIVLFVLGMAAQGHLLAADLSQLHIYCNTLQAIAAGYLIASIAMLHLRVPGQIVTAVVLLLGYWALLRYVPFPGHGAGAFEENANLALYIDKTILGRFHDGLPYTWILSSMNFGSMVLLGVFSGHLLRSGRATPIKLAGLLAIAAVCLGLGWAWSQDWMGGLRCPIIKHIFSSSMVLWAGGWCFLLLAAFYLVVDVLGLRRLAFFFIVIGSNSIVAYLAAELIGGNIRQIGDVFTGGLARNLIASQNGLLHAAGEAIGPLTAFMIVWLILLYLYRNGTFVRV
jgi:predicted acyltransferase